MKKNEIDVLPFMKNRKTTGHFDASEVYLPQRQAWHVPEPETEQNEDDIPWTWRGIIAELATAALTMGMVFVICCLLWFIA